MLPTPDGPPTTWLEADLAYVTTRMNGRYCSLWCRDAEARRKRLLPVLYVRKRPRLNPVPRETARVWIAGDCAWCGAPFVGRWFGTTDRYCSRSCGRSAVDRRRQVRVHYRYQKWITAARRYAIYARDHWTCQLCGEPVDATLAYNDTWAASLDHIQPRSLGGTHHDDNLRLTHRWCNAARDRCVQAGIFAG